MREQGPQRVRDQRLAVEFDVLLGDIAAEAATGARGGNDGPEPATDLFRGHGFAPAFASVESRSASAGAGGRSSTTR